MIEDFLSFKDFIILETRKNGLSHLVKIDKKNKQKEYIKFEDDAYSITLANNNDYRAKNFCFVFSSLKTPSTLYSQNLYSGNKKKLWNQRIIGHKEKNYKVERLFISSRDGTKVPISLIYKKGINLKKAPLLQYGYGSYGLVIEPSFKLSFMPPNHIHFQKNWII